MHEYSCDFVRRGKFQNPFTRSLQRNSFHFWGMLGICRSFLGQLFVDRFLFVEYVDMIVICCSNLWYEARNRNLGNHLLHPFTDLIFLPQKDGYGTCSLRPRSYTLMHPVLACLIKLNMVRILYIFQR